jgi:FecR protein
VREFAVGDLVGLRRGRGWVVALGVLCLWFAGMATSAWAYDAPLRRSARLSYLQGSVSVEHADNAEGEAAQLNMPLVQGLRLTTGNDGQAEIEFEDGSLVRMTPNSTLGLNNLSVDGSGDFQTQLALTRGMVYVELRAAPKYSYRIYAGGDVVTPLENATVRINLDETPAKVAVVTGSAQVERSPSVDGTGGYRVDVRAGESFAADVSDYSRYYLTHEIVPDSWDSWNEERDQAAADQAANRTEVRDNFAGDQGYGWSDMDANGSWYDVPGQGQVWQPEVATDPDFDPYGYGSWVWSPGAGYVWASGYEWGWTPFRCGNWSYWGGFGWGWMPGANCGFGGWGFGNTVYVINVIRPPLGYRPPRPLPVRGPGGVHPIVPVRPVHIPTVPLDETHGPRTIAGHTVEPLRPIGNAYTSRGGSVVGASLTRDFPVDRVNHQPVMGNTLGATQSTTPARGEWRSGAYRSNSGTALAPGQPARPMAPAGPPTHPAREQGEYHPAPRTFESAPRSMASPPRAVAPSLPPRPTYAPPPHPTSVPHPAPSAPATAPRSR